jgi:hypothetical protein
MNTEEIRRTCDAIAQGFNVEATSSADQFLQQISGLRGRPLELIPFDFPVTTMSGAWLATRSADYVFFEAQTNALHQRQIVFHEIGHMLWGHQSASAGAADIATLLPSLDPSAVETILSRNNFTVLEERQAECLATVLLHKVESRSTHLLPPECPPEGTVIGRLRQTLGSPSRSDSYA